jgi:hypothetical protein
MRQPFDPATYLDAPITEEEWHSLLDRRTRERDEARAERDAFQELACLLDRERDEARELRDRYEDGLKIALQEVDEARECCRRLAREWTEPTGWSGVLPEWVTQ